MLRYTFRVDTSLAIRDWDENLQRLCVVSLNEAVGKSYFLFFPSIICDGVDAVEKVIVETTHFQCSGYRIPCFFGEVRADVRVSPVVDEQSAVTGAVVEIYADHACSLARKLEQLQPLIDMAKSSTSLAHGVRNPLNAIKGAVTYLADTYQNDETLLEFTGIISEEIEKLSTFITHFLSSSGTPPESSPIDLNEFVKRIAIIAGFQAGPRGIRLRQSIASVPLVPGDAFQLEHALLNLVNNALEAMPEGGEIMFSTSSAVREGLNMVTVKISDNGPGFVHEPSSLDYPRGDRTPSGRGYGLFLSREIIQAHGGKLEISSERGVGTTIVVSLPAVGGCDD